jgi:hypothetical protein
MIAGAVAPWYTFTITSTVKVPASATSTTALNALTTSDFVQSSIKLYFDVQGAKGVVSGVCGAGVKSSYTTYALDSHVRNIVKTAMAFVGIALIAAILLSILLFIFFFDGVRNKIVFAIGMTITRLIAIFLSVLSLLGVIVAFLVFLGIVKAIKDDGYCTDGPCSKFVGSNDNTAVGSGVDCSGNAINGNLVSSQNWGPVEGWYIVLCTTLPAILLNLFVITNKFPLPIDSEASSGEAL